MSNESKPQEWFYLQNDTWNGPFKTSGLKELVKKGLVDPSTLLRLGVAGAPIKAHQVKSLFPNYQGDEQAATYSIKNEGILSILNDAPTMIGGAIIVVILLGILIFGLTQSDKKTTAGPSPSDKKATADSGQNGFKGASENSSKPDPQMPSKNVSQESLAEGIASIEKQMVIVPAGRFMMGDQSDRLERFQVTITKPFYMGKYEVTQEQWESVMGNNPSEAKGAKLPVTDVSWEDCQDFIKKLNAKTNGGYRLPTEAEWEYACRAGTTTAYSFGDSLSKSDANYGDRTAGSIKPVGTYKPNAFGLYDMHGNVMEWCNDWFDSFLQKDGEVTDRKGPATGDTRVLRGGSFIVNASGASSFTRIFNFPTLRVNFCGFRLARTADTKTAVGAPKVPIPEPAVVMPATVNILVAPFTEAKAKEVQKSLAKSLQKEVEEKVDLGQGIKLNLVLIPAGKFMMGSPASEEDRFDDETQHEVTLTKPFYMGKYEVTQEQWEGLMENNPSKIKGAKYPVTNVSWEDCQEFIKKLNAKPNGGYRLPTEAEWEHACRAGTTTAYSVGDSLTKSDANINGESTKAVGSYKPNAFGLYDMHGNVWEWCEDWLGYYPAGSAIDPMGPATGDRRVSRGGSFDSGVSLARSSDRFGNSPTFRYYGDGFRLVRTP
jgi:formylglycine-generating enzyme required for sulfatase activity